jgi:hypothetical protein
MLAPIVASALLLLTATAHPPATTTTEIDIKIPTEYPFPQATPFWVPPPPTLLGRNWEWASIPAWYSPAPPAPTSAPPYYHKESEHKATLTHEIIAAIIVGIFIGFPVLGVVCVWGYRRCWVNRRRKRGDVERGRRLTRDGERKRVFVDGDYVTRLTERPDMVYWSKDRR